MKKKFFTVISVQLFTAVLYFISLPILFRFMGAVEFAIYNLSLTILILLNYLNFGVPQYVFSAIGSSKPIDIKSPIIPGAIYTNFFIGCFLSFLLFLSNDIIVPSSKSGYAYISWLMCVTPFVMATLVLRATLEGFADFKRASLLRAALNLSFLVVPIGWVIGFGNIFVIIGHVFILSCIFVAFSRNLNLHIFHKGIFKSNVFKQIFIGGWPFFIISLCSMLLYYSDRYILPHFSDLAIIGAYLLIYDTLTRESIIFGALGQIIYTELSGVPENHVFSGIQLFTKPILYCHSSIMAIIVLFCEPLASFTELNDHEFIAIAIIIMSGLYGNIICTIFGKGLIFIGKEKTYSNIFFKETLYLYPVLFYLIYAFGVFGVSIFFLTRSTIEAVWVLVECEYKMIEILKMYYPLLFVLSISSVYLYLDEIFLFPTILSILLHILTFLVTLLYLKMAYKKLNLGL